MITTVWATVNLPGFHLWPDAPEHRSYLASSHRHLFRVTVWVVVSGPDREVEFHDLHDMIRTVWGPPVRNWGSASCESIAQQLAELLRGCYQVNPSRIEVSEDGEAGAVIEWTP